MDTVMILVAAFSMMSVALLIAIRATWNPHGKKGRRVSVIDYDEMRKPQEKRRQRVIAIGYDLLIVSVFITSTVLFIITKQWALMIACTSFVALIAFGVNPSRGGEKRIGKAP